MKEEIVEVLMLEDDSTTSCRGQSVSTCQGAVTNPQYDTKSINRSLGVGVIKGRIRGMNQLCAMEYLGTPCQNAMTAPEPHVNGTHSLGNRFGVRVWDWRKIGYPWKDVESTSKRTNAPVNCEQLTKRKYEPVLQRFDPD